MPLQPTFDLTKVSAPCRCRLPGLHGGSPGSAAAALCASACRRRVPEHGKRMGVTNAGLSAQPAHGNSACCPSAGIACNCYVAASGSRRGVTTPSSRCRDSCCATVLLLLLLLLAAAWRVVLKAYVWLSTVLRPDTIHTASDELPDVQEPGQCWRTAQADTPSWTVLCTSLDLSQGMHLQQANTTDALQGHQPTALSPASWCIECAQELAQACLTSAR